VVFYERARSGRLFDFHEGGACGPKYRFAFADIAEDVTTDKLTGTVIDVPLLQVFKRRVVGEPSATVIAMPAPAQTGGR
jgi:hypothetical protein